MDLDKNFFPAFVTLNHVYQVRKRTCDVIPYLSLLVCREEGVRCGSFKQMQDTIHWGNEATSKRSFWRTAPRR